MPRARPGRYSRFNELLAELRARPPARAKYLEGIGIRIGGRFESVYLKIRLHKGGTFRGKYISPGSAVEISLGRLTSWPWDKLIWERDRLQGLADRGEPIEETVLQSFREAAETWLDIKRNGRSYATTKGHINKHLIPAFGHLPIDRIELDGIHLWQAELLESYQPATVKRIRGTLQAILSYQVKKGVIERNWAQSADDIKGIEPRSRHLTAKEVNLVLKTARELDASPNRKEPWKHTQPWLESFLLWQLATGMRKSEALRLVWSDVDLTGNLPLVRIRQTKSGKPRTIPLGSATLEILEKLKAFPREKGDSRIFPISLSTVTRTLAKLWGACGVEDVRLHDLRRTCLSWLAADNVDLRTVQSIAGHADLNMLQKHYAQPLNQAAAAIAMEERLQKIG